MILLCDQANAADAEAMQCAVPFGGLQLRICSKYIGIDPVHDAAEQMILFHTQAYTNFRLADMSAGLQCVVQQVDEQTAKMRTFDRKLRRQSCLQHDRDPLPFC